MAKSYSEKLRDPRWQKKRLLIMGRDKFICAHCKAENDTLNVHHSYYVGGRDPWDYPDDSLVTVCEACHGKIEELRTRFGIEISSSTKNRNLFAELLFSPKLLPLYSALGSWNDALIRVREANRDEQAIEDLRASTLALFVMLSSTLSAAEEKFLGVAPE